MLVGGVPGDDLVLIGDYDVDGDFIVDYSGTLLTGEIGLFLDHVPSSEAAGDHGQNVLLIRNFDV
jgi:hypothetical protein